MIGSGTVEAETRGLDSPRDAMACLTSGEGRRSSRVAGNGSGTITLRMLKPEVG